MSVGMGRRDRLGHAAWLSSAMLLIFLGLLVITPPRSGATTSSVHAYDVVPHSAPTRAATTASWRTVAPGSGQKRLRVAVWSEPSSVISVVAAEAEPGAWATANESMSARAAAYQEQITGASSGSVYEVNGVKFDGYSDGVLQEAKGPGYANFVKGGEFVSWFQGEEGLVSQAESQLRAAGGTPIIWSVAEPQAAEEMQALFADRGIVGINVVYVPPAA